MSIGRLTARHPTAEGFFSTASARSHAMQCRLFRSGCGYVHCYSPLDLLNVEYSVPCGELPAAIAFREAILRARRRHDAEIGELPQ